MADASASSSNGVKWGILGVGAVCERKSGPPLYRCRGSSLVAVMRRDAAKAQDFAERHSSLLTQNSDRVSDQKALPIKAYSDAEALVNDKNVNAVYIAAPPGAHYSLAMLSLAVGKPTYIEKPLARTAEESR